MHHILAVKKEQWGKEMISKVGNVVKCLPSLEELYDIYLTLQSAIIQYARS